MKKNKKLFPKIKSKIKNFLSDESGKITKKDALGLAAGVALLSMVDEVGAENFGAALRRDEVDVDVTCSHTNGTTICAPAHGSGFVNGHYSNSTITGSPNNPIGWVNISGHASHASHGSHGSHGQW